VQDVAGAGGEHAEDFRHLIEAANHLPQPPPDLDSGKLGDGVARQHLDQFTRGMRDQIERHRPAHRSFLP
jgi:hypothetical protein